MANKPMNDEDSDDLDAKKAALQQIMQANPDIINNVMGTTKTYNDTGAQASNPSDVADSYLGAPIRQGIGQMQQGNFSGAAQAALNQMGNDPSTAPTGEQLVNKAGLTGTPGKIAGYALETATDPTSYFGDGPPIAGGVGGTIKNVAEDEAKPLFNKVQQYFKAGNISYPAANTAEAMKIKKALENAGKIPISSPLLKKQ